MLVTHDQGEALATADDILLLRDGRIAPQEIYSNPNSFYSADFLGNNNVVLGRVMHRAGDEVTIGGEGWTLKASAREAGLDVGHKVRAVIRVEEITISDREQPSSVEMQLTDSIYLGSKWEYRIKRGDFTARAHGTRPFPPGKVWTNMPKEKLWVSRHETAGAR